MSGRRLVIAVAIVSAASSIGAAQAPAGRRAADVVAISVAVTHHDGSVARGLTSTDFTVTSDGHPSSIVSLSMDDRPMTLIVMIDVTASANTKLSDVLSLVDDAVFPRLRRGDHIRLGLLGGRVWLSPSFTADSRDWKALTLAANLPSSPSPIWDAVDTAVTALEHETDRRALLLVTDGRATANRLTIEDAVRHAVAAGVIVSVIGTAPVVVVHGDAVVHPELLLSWMTATTGGTFPTLDAMSKPMISTTVVGAIQMPAPRVRMDTPFEHAMDGLRDRYRIEIATAHDGRVHALDVQVAGLDLSVHAPQMYLAVPAK